MAVPTPGLGAPPPPAKRKRSGCLGCFIPLLVIVALLAAGFYFLVLQASAAVSVPAQLIVVSAKATLTHGGSAQAAISGQLVHAGDQVQNDAGGRSLIQFQDGSITRLAPNTKVTLGAAQFDKQGRLSKVSISQQAGRTLSTVQKLVGGAASFTVSGHSASASVRGTKFEVVQNADGSVRLKTYVGLVRLAGSNGSSVDVAAGQQADANPQGAVSKPVAITADPADPFTLWVASEEGAKAAGQPGTAQTNFSAAPLASGQTSAQTDYQTAGGEVIGELAYPGSQMTLSITDPNGRVFESSAAAAGPAGKMVVVDMPNAPGGTFHVKVRGDNVNPSENFAVTMITKFVCAAGSTDVNGVVRNVMSANDIKNSLVQSGGSNVSLSFSGASAGGANISGSGSFSGVQIAGSALLYASGGGLVSVSLTSASVNGINVTDRVTSALSQATGHNLDGLQTGFSVDRVYACSANRDSFLVIEGHH